MNGEVRVGVGLRILIYKSAYARTARGTTKISSQPVHRDTRDGTNIRRQSMYITDKTAQTQRIQLGTARNTQDGKYGTAQTRQHGHKEHKLGTAQNRQDGKIMVQHRQDSTDTKNTNIEREGMPAWDLSTTLPSATCAGPLPSS